ncbi:serine/threonine-protein kinase [Kutzneria chonburiensis]|uniref:non-specific serine/threonine protein kinase n=1 Tax=Kutzneria chonburiensis TaxID=1483604 RepID=A0ABV6MPB2_9PSEU|nr:serine/threonine-protein kinase [Kutzneria chonburiensis]
MTAPANVVNALPQYELGAMIGAGGMGVVYAGVHRSLGRHVAIKQLPADMVHKPGMGSRFDREAKVLASLDHPHIVPVYDYVRTARDSLLVMEKLDGGTVFDRSQGRGITPDAACAIILATLAGLHAAHSAGVLHLDVKPKNLLFTRQGVLKVADFGIAQVISEGTTLVTHGGEVLGTPAYISPEQASGNPLTPAADVYSAGTVLYEMLSGTLPFADDRGALSMMRQHIFGDPRPITGVPAPLAEVVMRSVARETHQRYRDAEGFAADLAAAADTTFGPGWLQQSRIPVHLSPRVTSGGSQPRPRPTLHATQVEEGTRSDWFTGEQPKSAWPEENRTVREHTARLDEEPDTRRQAGTLPVNGAYPGQAGAQPTDRSQSGRLDAAPADRRPREATRRSALVPTLVAVLAFVALVVTAFIAPTPGARTAVTQLAVMGSPPGQPANIDLSLPVPITGGEATMSLWLAGFQVASASGKDSVAFPALTRWLVGGAVTGRLQSATGTQEFPAIPQQFPLASAMGAGSLLACLFALAYLESTLRTVRRGRTGAGKYVAAVPLGALFGLGGWLLVAVLAAHEPALPFGIGCAVAGALTAVATVWATAVRAPSRA